jgi:hypothetical protein
MRNGLPFVYFLEWLHGSLFAGIKGRSMCLFLRTNNLLDWEVV